MINISNPSEFNNTMDQWLLQYYDSIGNKWKDIQNKFLMDKKINIINTATLKQRYRILNTLDGKQRITLNKDESDMCWLVGIKACSCRLPIQKVWEKNTLARKVDSSTLRLEFLKLFQQGLLQINLIAGADRQKNTQIIKTISDSTIYLSIRVIREDVKDQYFNQMKLDFQRMITVITYVVMSKTIMNESILSFCNKEQFENAIQNLSKLDQMRLLSLKGDQLVDPLQKTYTYAKLFIKEPLAFDPFQDSDYENSDDMDNKKKPTNNNNNKNNTNNNNTNNNTNNNINTNYNQNSNSNNTNIKNYNQIYQKPLKPEKQDIVIDDGLSLSFEKQEEEDDSGSYEIEDISQ